MSWITDSWDVLRAAVGARRYVLLSLATGVVAIATGIYLYFTGRDMALTAQIAIGASVILLVLFVTVLDYGVRLHRTIRPKIAIRFEPHDPFIRPTPARVPKLDNPHERVDADAIFLRVRVENLMPNTVARGCLIYLTDITKEVRPGEFGSIGYGDTLRLAWSARPADGWYNPINIPGNTRIFADLLSVDSVHNGIYVKWEQDLLAHKHLFDEPGKYKFDLLASCDPGKPTSASIIVDWTGEWSEITAILVRECGESGSR